MDALGVAAVIQKIERSSFHRDIADLGIEALIIIKENVEDAVFRVFE
jgi:hypothetical protein